MFSPLADRTYRHMFAAQVLSLLGTGLMTVALGLLAFKLAGAGAGAVLGTVLAIKMIAYVTIAPVAGAFVHLVPRRALLVGLDVVRAMVALAQPWVTELWQAYLLVGLLQSCSAAFTPSFQATIPEVLPNEAEYTRALSLSRLAYDLELLSSPMLAATLLAVMGFHWLFAGTVLGFLASAVLVLSVVLPAPAPAADSEGAWHHTKRGARLYLATARLRGLLALNLAVAAAGAMVIVNSVVLVRAGLGLDEGALAWTLACCGFGSMTAALALPRVLRRLDERSVMLAGAVLLAGPILLHDWRLVLALWVLLGLGNGLVLTPARLVLRRSGTAGELPALFATQFALSHACWLLTYPLAGWLGVNLGLAGAFLVLGALAVAGTLAALMLWPARDLAAAPPARRGG
jgi:hypothetical protein